MTNPKALWVSLVAFAGVLILWGCQTRRTAKALDVPSMPPMPPQLKVTRAIVRPPRPFVPPTNHIVCWVNDNGIAGVWWGLYSTQTWPPTNWTLIQKQPGPIGASWITFTNLVFSNRMEFFRVGLTWHQ